MRESFESFWTVFPRKMQKEEAGRLLLKIVTGRHEHRATPEEIVEGARAYAAQRKVELKYVPSPTKWLAEARWHDSDVAGWKQCIAEEEDLKQQYQRLEEQRRKEEISSSLGDMT